MPLPATEPKTKDPHPSAEINPIASRFASSGDPTDQATARILAKYLDELLRIPGTDIRFGLDSILGLFPVVGDFVVSGAGGIILIEALRSGVSFAVLARMALNMSINFLIGLIPGAGAVLSIFFKSNTRNLAILTAWQAGQHQAVRRSTLRYYLGLLALIGLFIAFLLTIWLIYGYLLYTLLKPILPAHWL